MQVFIVGTPFETARALDKRRLNKQIMNNIDVVTKVLMENVTTK